MGPICLSPGAGPSVCSQPFNVYSLVVLKGPMIVQFNWTLPYDQLHSVSFAFLICVGACTRKLAQAMDGCGHMWGAGERTIASTQPLGMPS